MKDGFQQIWWMENLHQHHRTKAVPYGVENPRSKSQVVPFFFDRPPYGVRNRSKTTVETLELFDRQDFRWFWSEILELFDQLQLWSKDEKAWGEKQERARRGRKGRPRAGLGTRAFLPFFFLAR